MFEARSTTFSIENAKVLGQASAVAYRDEATCQRWAEFHGFTENVRFFDTVPFGNRSNTQGFIAQSPEAIIVAFRGTQPNQMADWLSDVRLLRETWENPIGKLHKGFYEAHRVVWGAPFTAGELLPKRLIERGERTLWITGHSLGGALAQICAAYAHFVSHVPVSGVYTFGQPRVGDEPFAELAHAALGTRTFRFVNHRDVVPRVPIYGMGFRHYGTPIIFDEDCRPSPDAPAVESLAAALFLAWGLRDRQRALREAVNLFGRAARETGLSGDFRAVFHNLVESAEGGRNALMHTLLQQAVQPIADHDMRNQYLHCLGTDLDFLDGVPPDGD